jgi:DNA-binding response OmpR family regulator
MSSSPRVLAIEDDPRMLELLRKGLWEQGHLVLTASNGREGLQLGSDHEFDVIILDVGLPELDGYQVAARLRANGCRAPMLMLTAMDLEDDIVRGLELGADGYMTKPFSFRELLARIDSLTRRAKMIPTDELRVADLMIDPIHRTVFHAGRCVSLTRSEFLLLERLMQHAGRPLPRKTLEDTIWGADTPVSRGVLDTLINSLRGKLDAQLGVSLIKTIRGLGYCLQNGPDALQKQNT